MFRSSSISPFSNPFPQDNIQWLLNDEFLDVRAAGAINGTMATDGKNLRTVIDTNGKLSIGSGLLSYATGGLGNGDPRISWPSMSRLQGRAIIGRANNISGSGANYIGWDSDSTSLPIYATILNISTVIVARNSGVNLNVGTISQGTFYTIATVLRNNGCHHLIWGGAYTNWTLLYVTPILNNATLYPCNVNGSTTHVGVTDYVRVPLSTISILPLVSDSFNRANGALGTSDRVATEETAINNPTWVDRLGTSAITSNVAGFSALSGSVGQATLETNIADVLVEVEVTRTSGDAGIVARWTDANNYLFIYQTGTAVIVVEVVGGSPTTLLNTAITYAAGARLSAALFGNKIRIFYNAAVAGGEITTNITSGTKHGLHATTTSATLNNFVVWARGTNGEYNAAMNRFTR